MYKTYKTYGVTLAIIFSLLILFLVAISASEQSFCYETDNGSNYFLKGDVNSSNGTVTDYCQGEFLIEYSCVNYTYVQKETVNCSRYNATCQEGICASLPEVDPFCGDGTCDINETWLNCPSDCQGPYCGDEICNGNETWLSCPEDCEGPYCGDGICNNNETWLSCPNDCEDPFPENKTSHKNKTEKPSAPYAPFIEDKEGNSSLEEINDSTTLNPPEHEQRIIFSNTLIYQPDQSTDLQRNISRFYNQTNVGIGERIKAVGTAPQLGNKKIKILITRKVKVPKTNLEQVRSSPMEINASFYYSGFLRVEDEFYFLYKVQESSDIISFSLQKEGNNSLMKLDRSKGLLVGSIEGIGEITLTLTP